MSSQHRWQDHTRTQINSISSATNNLLHKQQFPGDQPTVMATWTLKDSTKQAQGPAHQSWEEWTTAPQQGWAPNRELGQLLRYLKRAIQTKKKPKKRGKVGSKKGCIKKKCNPAKITVSSLHDPLQVDSQRRIHVFQELGTANTSPVL